MDYEQQRKAGSSSSSSCSVPLLESSSKGTASIAQTLGNIIVSVIGTGVLGLPFAFRIAGWLAGLFGVIIVGLCSYYCMLLLVSSFISLSLSLLFFFPQTFSSFQFFFLLLVIDRLRFGLQALEIDSLMIIL